MTMQNAKVIKYLIGLILIALPGYLIRFSIFGIPTTALEIAIYLLFIFYFLFFILGRAKFYWPGRVWLIPIGLFVLGALIGSVVSPDKRVALGQLKGFIFDPILFALVVYSALRSKIVDKDWVVYSLMWGGGIISIGAILLLSDPEGRALSFYSFDNSASANFLALLIAPILVLVISKLKYALPPEWFKWGGAGLVPLLALGLFRSGSRGGLVGLGLAVLYLIYQKTKKTLVKKSLIAATFVFLVLTFYLSRPDLSATPDSGRVSSSNNIRYEIWTTTKEILTKDTKNFLFGVGLGNYQNYFTQLTKDRVNYPEFIAPKALTPHNIFLAIWLNGGLVMLAGFVWLIILALRKPSFLPAQAALIALLGHGLVDTPYFKNDLSVLFWVLVVLAITNFKTLNTKS